MEAVSWSLLSPVHVCGLLNKTLLGAGCGRALWTPQGAPVSDRQGLAPVRHQLCLDSKKEMQLTRLNHLKKPCKFFNRFFKDTRIKFTQVTDFQSLKMLIEHIKAIHYRCQCWKGRAEGHGYHSNEARSRITSSWHLGELISG